MKTKAEELEKERVRNYLSCIVVKNADGKTLKQLDKLCLTCFEFGKKEGCDGVLRKEREILDFLKKEFDKHYFDRRKVRDGLTNDTQLFIDYGYLNGLELAIQLIEKHKWEGFKHDKKR